MKKCECTWNKLDPEFKPARAIPKESITIIQPDYAHKFIRYRWVCPGCGSEVNGDQQKDTIFEIRHDALCVYCRCRLGEMRYDGASFKHIPRYDNQ